MTSILDWGAEVIVWLQQLSPTLDVPFKGLTALGDEEFFMLLLPLVYWCVDRRVGVRLAILFLLSGWANSTVKALAAQPRPFDYDPRVKRLVEAGSYGLPSGHTQGTVVVWGYLAARLRRRWLWALAALLMVCVPLSRVYLGVHFPTDLVGGYVLGVACLLLFVHLGPRAEAWLLEQGLRGQLAVAVAAPVLLALLCPTRNGVAAGGALMGMGVGFALERRWVGFEAGGAVGRRALRFVLGGALLVGLQLGLKAALAGLEPALVLRFTHYVVLGLSGALGAPWAFVRVRLAQRVHRKGQGRP